MRNNKMLDITIRKYTQTTNKTRALLHTTGCEDKPNISLCGYCIGHHKTELGTYRHIIRQHIALKKVKNTDPHQNNRG